MRVAAVWVMLPLAFGAAACDGGRVDGEAERPATTPAATSPSASATPRTAPSAPAADGAKLYMAQGCGACHGPNAQGGMLGPAMGDLGAHWTREDLAAFLADPESWVQESARLAEQKARYPMQMPGVPNLGEAERLALADWLLAR